MKIKKMPSCFFLFLMLFIFSGINNTRNEECTTAVISEKATAVGKSLLWKNRDSDYPSNKVIYVKETPFSYIAIINSEDPNGRMVWAGMNSEGFAIMNSVAYNLDEPEENKLHDLEGIIMADALRTFKTIDEFETFLKNNIGPNFGSQANFGVIDAYGGSALFEVSNKEYNRLNAADFPRKYIINTNFARSGEENKGRGYLRYDRAAILFKEAPESKPSLEYLLQIVTRDLGHALLSFISIAE